MPRQLLPTAGRTFATDAEVDFLVIGSGAAGGAVARELTREGFDVLVLEQGHAFGPEEMEHDEIGAFFTPRWTNDPETQKQTYRQTPDEKAEERAVRGVREDGGRHVVSLHRQLLALPADRLQ